MDYKLRELSFGELIIKSFKLYVDNLAPLLIMNLAAQIPSIVVEFLNSGSTNYYSRSSLINGDTIMSFVSGILQIVIQGYIIHFITKRYLKENAYHPLDIKNNWQFIKKLVGLALVMLLIITLPFIIAFTIFPTQATLLIGIIVMLVLLLSCTFAPHILVTQKKGVIESLKGSWKLIDGSRRTVLGVYFVTTAAYLILLAAAISLAAFFSNNNIDLFSAIVDSSEFSLITTLINLFTTPIISCAITLMYYNLRIRDEGLDIEKLAKDYSKTFDTE